MVQPKEPIAGVVYHPPEAVERYRAAGLFSGQTLGQALKEAFVRHADRTALVSPDGTLTYRELDDLSARAGAAFLRLGLRPLDRMVFQLGNVPEFFAALYGCFRTGIIPVCNLVSHRESEIVTCAGLSGARAHIIQGDFKYDLRAVAAAARAAPPALEHVIVARGERSGDALAFRDLLDREDGEAAQATLAALEIDPFNAGIFQLSGGTTGIPKIIPRFHYEYLYHCLAWAEVSAMDESTVCYWPLPAVHNAAMACFNTPTHLLGGRVCIDQRHDPEVFLGTIERERVTFSGAALPIIVRAVDSGLVDRHDLSSVKCFISLGETVAVERDLKLPGNHIYGMAEGLLMRTLDEDPAEVRQRGIGRPVSPHDEMKLVKIGTEAEVEPGEAGELLVRGPYTIQGFYNVPEHNARAFTADGFYRTGDLMRLREIDGRGYYFFVGRAKDNIDRAMEKISAEEVESAVLRHPDVRECMVIGMPDRQYGERVCAYVILRPDAPAMTVQSLGAFLQTTGLAKFKWPERIEVVDNFPTTSVGKTSKALLRDDIRRKLEDEAKLIA